MKLLLMISAVFEGLVGLGLLLVPVVVVSSLLNTPLDTPGGLLTARLAGAAIIALAMCCWQARGGERSGAALGIVTAMLYYNLAAATVLAYGSVRLELQSVFIWPLMVLHGALGLWCAALVWLAVRKQERSNSE